MALNYVFNYLNKLGVRSANKQMVSLNYVEKRMCPIGLASHLLGDKWIPIIIRDIALFDRRTFSDLIKGNHEGISSGSLTSRLKRMVELDLVRVENSEKHAQKKIYFLTEAGISFVPVLFNLAAWTEQFRSPSRGITAMVKPYIDGDEKLSRKLLQTLRDIHIKKSVEPEPLWWLFEAETKPLISA